MSKSVTITAALTTVTSSAVILAAGVLGFTALYDLFVSIGLFSPWLGYLFPLLFDLAEVTAAIAVFNAKLQGEDDAFAWRLVLLFTVLGVIANVTHAGYAWYVARITAPQLLLAIFATSLFPISVALVTHLLKTVIERSLRRYESVTTLATLAQQRRQAAGTLAALRGEIDQLSDRRAALQAELNTLKQERKAASYTGIGDATKAAALEILRNDADITGAELGRLLGKSGSTGRKLKRELAPALNGSGAR